jgi:hypothetical protein
MGDSVNGHLCEAFVREFGEEILPRAGISHLHGDALVEKKLAWDESNYEVRIFYVIRDADDDENEVCGTTVYYTPNDDLGECSNFLSLVLHGTEASDEQTEAILARLKKMEESA